MKEEKFNLPEDIEFYKDVDYLNPSDLDNMTSDNLFLSNLERDGITYLGIIIGINDKIYDFATHKYLDDRTTVLYAQQFSDYMPSSIWKPIYITNYGIICIDIDDDKFYIVDQWLDNKSDIQDKEAKEKVLKRQIQPNNKK